VGRTGIVSEMYDSKQYAKTHSNNTTILQILLDAVCVIEIWVRADVVHFLVRYGYEDD